MNPEIPLFPTRTIATRFSTARSVASAHMWVYTGAPNTPSLVMLSRKSAPCPAARRAKSALDASKQIGTAKRTVRGRSEEHTSELQSQSNLVCRLLLEKKKKEESTRRAD